MSGGQQTTGGLDVSASGGALLATQARTAVSNGELYHVAPFNADANGQIVWTFDWQAPLVDSNIVLYAAALSANGNFSTSGDAGATTTLAITVSTGGGTAPVAVPGGPYTGVANTQVLFDGSASSDADGTIVSYSWDFGDGGTASGVTPSHTYTTAGTYTVSLTVTDNSNMTDTKTTSATIAADTVYDGVALYGTYCSSCHGTLANSSKAGRTAAQIQNAIDSNTGGMGSASLGLVNLIPAEVQAISDALSGTSILPIADPGAPYSGIVDTAVRFDGGGSTDPNGSIVSYNWDFGDGTAATGVSPSHTYTVAGQYTVTLTVTDNDGNTDSATTTATISTSTVLDGLALYNTNCSGCHGAAPGDKAGRTATQIRDAINSVQSMSGLSGLTDAELQAIADAIRITPPTDGKGLYEQYCSACHGPGGTGGTEGDVRGKSADAIQEAIDEESAMNYLDSLLSSDAISRIAVYLNQNREDEDKGDGDRGDRDRESDD